MGSKDRYYPRNSDSLAFLPDDEEMLQLALSSNSFDAFETKVWRQARRKGAPYTGHAADWIRWGAVQWANTAKDEMAAFLRAQRHLGYGDEDMVDTAAALEHLQRWGRLSAKRPG